MAEEMPNCKLLLAAMRFWTTFWTDELTLAAFDYNSCSVNKNRRQLLAYEFCAYTCATVNKQTAADSV